MTEMINQQMETVLFNFFN